MPGIKCQETHLANCQATPRSLLIPILAARTRADAFENARILATDLSPSPTAMTYGPSRVPVASLLSKVLPGALGYYLPSSTLL